MQPNYTPNTDTDFSETQLKKMFRAFLNGNEQSLKWNEILKHFCDLPDARQRKALSLLPLDSFESLFDSVQRSYENVFKEKAEQQKAHKEKLTQIRALLLEEGISVEELAAFDAKNKVTAQRLRNPKGGTTLTEKEAAIFEVIKAHESANSIANVSTGVIATELAQTEQWVSNGIAKLKKKGLVETVSGKRGQYRILSDD